MNLPLFFSVVACLVVTVNCGYFRLQEGYEYVYKEEVECHLGGTGTIVVKAKVSHENNSN
jgi:hypothetical protein